jgi:hypothetical protein
MDAFVKNFGEHEFGSSDDGYDFAGREVRKGAHGKEQEGSRYLWNIDHILPVSMGGTNDLNNLQITRVDTNSERANRMSFWINDVIDANGNSFQISYQVKRVTRTTEDDDVVDYDYNNKKYCIIILESIPNTEEDSFYDYLEDDD